MTLPRRFAGNTQFDVTSAVSESIVHDLQQSCVPPLGDAEDDSRLHAGIFEQAQKVGMMMLMMNTMMMTRNLMRSGDDGCLLMYPFCLHRH
jgi:hypothetical protein